MRQEEFKAVRQEEEKAVRRVESRAVAHFVHAEGAADGNEGLLFRACKAEFFINVPNRRFVEDVRAHGEPGRIVGHGVLDGEGAAQDDEVGVLNVAEVVEDEIEVQEAVDHLIQMLHVFGILLQLVHIQSHADSQLHRVQLNRIEVFPKTGLVQGAEFAEDEELAVVFEVLDALLQQVGQEGRRVVVARNDLNGRAVFLYLCRVVLVQRRAVGGAEILTDFKSQVLDFAGNREGFIKFFFFFLFYD